MDPSSTWEDHASDLEECTGSEADEKSLLGGEGRPPYKILSRGDKDFADLRWRFHSFYFPRRDCNITFKSRSSSPAGI